MFMKISEIIEATNAKIIGNLNQDLNIKISTDTRTIQKGDFYLPLKGASFDGEKFISQALEKGAIGTFCTENLEDYKQNSDKIFLQVPDTLIAYLQLANYRRNKLNLTVVAVTGSSGKTTTKELIASTLASSYKVFKTPLNHNNEVGLCQTIFATPDDTEILVLEMGMRGLGEIELLSKYAQPDITVISNVGTAHIGRLGSRENIAQAKCEITKYQRGDLFVAHDDELIKNTVDFEGKKIFYSINIVDIIEKKQTSSSFRYKEHVYKLNVGGDYNIENSLAAIIIAENMGMDVEKIQIGLENYKPIEKRWEAVTVSGYEIINDSYNANPESMKAFVDTVFELYEDYVLVLGDMGELGENELRYHSELGKYINSKNPSAKIITIGKLSKHISDECLGVHFESMEKAVEYIKANYTTNTKLFLKASRSMKFENIIELLS